MLLGHNCQYINYFCSFCQTADRMFPVTEEEMMRNGSDLLSEGLKGRGSHSLKHCACHTHAGTRTQHAQKLISINEGCKMQPIRFFWNMCSELARRFIKTRFLPRGHHWPHVWNYERLRTPCSFLGDSCAVFYSFFISVTCQRPFLHVRYTFSVYSIALPLQGCCTTPCNVYDSARSHFNK